MNTLCGLSTAIVTPTVTDDLKKRGGVCGGQVIAMTLGTRQRKSMVCVGSGDRSSQYCVRAYAYSISCESVGTVECSPAVHWTNKDQYHSTDDYVKTGAQIFCVNANSHNILAVSLTVLHVLIYLFAAHLLFYNIR